MRGAGNAGVVSVWLNRNGSERTSDDPLPDAQIVSLAELPELVPRLLELALGKALEAQPAPGSDS